MEYVEIRGKTYECKEYYIPNMIYECMLCSQNRSAGTASLSLSDKHLLNHLGYLIPDSEYQLFYFNRIFVPTQFRGHGLGSFLLEKVIDFARREKKAIINEINPYGEMDLEELTDFFVRHGFKVLKEGVVYWSPK